MTGDAQPSSPLPIAPLRSRAAAKPPKERRSIQSVDRALDILEALSQARRGLPLFDLSGRIGLNVSTCHHLLSTLAARGYVVQDARSREYALGNRVFELGEARSRQIDIVGQAMPWLEAINEETGEAVHLAVMQASELVTLVKLDSLHAVKVDSGVVGKSRAAHATATGKAILAFMEEDELAAFIARRGMERFTPRTIGDFEALKRELATVRAEGVAGDVEEFQPGVLCLGAPIRDHAGAVVASLSCSLPLMRAGAAEQERVRGLVLGAAREISRQIGFKPPA